MVAMSPSAVPAAESGPAHTSQEAYLSIHPSA